MPPAREDFRSRLRLLIGRYDEGVINRTAKRARVRPRGLAKVYHGDVKNPTLDMVLKILRAFPRDAWWLLTGEEREDVDQFNALVEATAHKRTIELLTDLVKTLKAQEGGGTPTTRTVAAVTLKQAARTIRDRESRGR